VGFQSGCALSTNRKGATISSDFRPFFVSGFSDFRWVGRAGVMREAWFYKYTSGIGCIDGGTLSSKVPRQIEELSGNE